MTHGQQNIKLVNKTLNDSSALLWENYIDFRGLCVVLLGLVA
jgi:hypothetical protein